MPDNIYIIMGCGVLGLLALALLVHTLSGLASRAYFAEKEKHIRRTLKLAKHGDDHE